MKNKFSDNILNINDISIIQTIISLSIIICAGIIIRIIYFPYDIPIIADGLDYFSYAYTISEIGKFPVDWALSNNTWSAFVSVFFSLTNAETFLENISIQRWISIGISVLTPIPIFFLCNRFFNKTFSLIGSSIFIFDPRIILNSTAGIIEPSYILIGSLTLHFFLSNNKKIIFTSFFLVGIFSLLRWEGILLIFSMTPLFIIRFKQDKKIIQETFLIISIFFIAVLPMIFINIENTGTDGLISPFLKFGPGYIEDYIIKDYHDEYLGNNQNENKILTLTQNSIQNTFKFVGWIMIPIFIVFLPISVIMILKNNIIKRWNYQKTIILVFMIVLFLPSLYAFARNFNDTRFLYVLYPIFCVISLFIINKILEKNAKKKIIVIGIIIGIIISSIVFLEITKEDHDIEKEKFEIAKILVANVEGTNLSSFTKYFTAAQIENNWPNIPNPDQSGHVTSKIAKFSIDEHITISEFIIENESKGLTHITAEKGSNGILHEIYLNSQEYPFLEEIFDSSNNGMKNEVKIFKINFNVIKNES